MAATGINEATSTGTDWKQYGAGAADFMADFGGPVRRIVMLAAGDLSPCVNAADVNRALTGLPSGYVHDACVQSCTSTAAFIAYK
jgi:hypothetical protein